MKPATQTFFRTMAFESLVSFAASLAILVTIISAEEPPPAETSEDPDVVVLRELDKKLKHLAEQVLEAATRQQRAKEKTETGALDEEAARAAKDDLKRWTDRFETLENERKATRERLHNLSAQLHYRRQLRERFDKNLLAVNEQQTRLKETKGENLLEFVRACLDLVTDANSWRDRRICDVQSRCVTAISTYVPLADEESKEWRKRLGRALTMCLRILGNRRILPKEQWTFPEIMKDVQFPPVYVDEILVLMKHIPMIHSEPKEIAEAKSRILKAYDALEEEHLLSILKAMNELRWQRIDMEDESQKKRALKNLGTLLKSHRDELAKIFGEDGAE